MDDDLLADDGQYKDDGLDDLDIDEEAALLGLSDEDENGVGESSNRNAIEQELEYVDEEGNPVEIGESNADLYELAEFGNNNQKFASSSQDDDVLEVDVDELESFSPETTDTNENNEPSPKKPAPKKPALMETRYQENLISVPLVPSKPHTLPKVIETFPQHVEEKPVKVEESQVSSSLEIDTDETPSSRFELEESEEENVEEDDHRDRFKSERSNIITLTSVKRRTDIPDTLDSVISDEENAKVQAFLAKEQKRKLRLKNRNVGRGRGFPGTNREQLNVGYINAPPKVPFQNLQVPVSTPQPRMSQPVTFQKIPTAVSTPQPKIVPQVPYQKVSVTVSSPQPRLPQQTAPRKILINPHFRGPRPNTTVSDSSFQQTSVSQISSGSGLYNEQYPTTFSSSGGNPSMYSFDPGAGGEGPHVYSETCHPVNQPDHQPPPFTHQPVQLPCGPPNYAQPPPPVPFHPNEPPPPLHISSDLGHQPQRIQAPNEMWMNPPPPISMPSTQSYSTQPPVPTYQEPPPPLSSASISNFSTPVSSALVASGFQSQRVPVSMPVGFRRDQPPPPIQHFNPLSSSTSHSQQFQPVTPMVPSLRNQPPTRFPVPKEPLPQNQRQFSQAQRQNQNFLRRAQKFSRSPEKRPASGIIRTPPNKHPRLENSSRNANIQIRMQNTNIKSTMVKNSNIREIPLIENIQSIPTVHKSKENFMEKSGYVEEEDEETRELRMKIEEQKLLREQILKLKEERRRQMAAQRMQDLRKRQKQEQQQQNKLQQDNTKSDVSSASPNTPVNIVQTKVSAVPCPNEPAQVKIAPPVRQATPKGRQNAPQINQASPQAGQASPQVRQAAPQIRQASPQVRQGPPQVRQGPPQVKQGPPQVKQGPPQVRQGPPQVRQSFSQMRQGSPQMRQQPPQVRQQPPQVRQISQVQQAATAVKQASPQIRQAVPQIRQASPQVRQSAPQIRQDAPQIRQDAPQIRQGAPQIRQGAPQIRQGAPQQKQVAPQIRQATPQVKQTSPQVVQVTPTPSVPAAKKKVVVVRKKNDSPVQVPQNPPQEPKKALSVHDRLGTRPVAKKIQLTNVKSNQQKVTAQNSAAQKPTNNQKKPVPKQPIKPPETTKQPVRPPETAKNVPVQNVKPLPRTGGLATGVRTVKLGRMQTRGVFQRRGFLSQQSQFPKSSNQRPWMKNTLRQRLQMNRFQNQHLKPPSMQEQQRMFPDVRAQRMPQNALGQHMPSPRYPGPRSPAPPFHMPPFPNQPPPLPPPPPQNNPMPMQRMPYMPYNNNNNNNAPAMPHQSYMGGERMQSPEFFYRPSQNENFSPPMPPPRMPGPSPGGHGYHQSWGQPGGSMNIPRPRMLPSAMMYNERPPFFHHEQRPMQFQKRRMPEPNFQGAQRMRGPPPRFLPPGPMRHNRLQVMSRSPVPQQRPKVHTSNQNVTVATASVRAEPASSQKINHSVKPATEAGGESKKSVEPSNGPPKVPQNQIQKLESSVNSQPAAGKSQSVVIQNLSSSTNELQLKKLCSGIGPVENIQLLKSEKKAVVRFKDSVHASDFQKKYQRYMLDLAMIQVSLLPQ